MCLVTSVRPSALLSKDALSHCLVLAHCELPPLSDSYFQSGCLVNITYKI